MNLNIDVIIPALNEAKAIPRVLGEIPTWVRQVIVVDNGSKDGTGEIARLAGARVEYESRRGYGYACLKGISVLDKPDVVVFLDGDFSDFPSEMERLVKPIRDGQADLVIGSRLAGRMQPGSMPRHAVWGNQLLSWMLRRITGCHITDIGPFRAITWDCLNSLEMQEGRYGWTLEMMLKVFSRNYRMVELPVSYRPRLGHSKVSGSPIISIKAAIVMLATMLRYARS